MTLGEILRLIVEGYTAPRRSMRRLLDGGNGFEVALSMLALAFLVEAILAVVFGAGGGASVGVYLVNVVLQVVLFFLLSGLIYGMGRLAGGRGTLAGAQLVVGWHALVTSPMAPLTVPIAHAFRAPPETAQVQLPAGSLFLAFVYATASFWLMANYVAELHQFRSAWGVLGALVGVTFACGIVLASVAGAFE